MNRGEWPSIWTTGGNSLFFRAIPSPDYRLSGHLLNPDHDPLCAASSFAFNDAVPVH